MSPLLTLICILLLLATGAFFWWALVQFIPPPRRPTTEPLPPPLTLFRFGDSSSKGGTSVVTKGNCLHVVAANVLGFNLTLPLKTITEATKVDPTSEVQCREFVSSLHPGEILDFGDAFNAALSAVLKRRRGQVGRASRHLNASAVSLLFAAAPARQPLVTGAASLRSPNGAGHTSPG